MRILFLLFIFLFSFGAIKAQHGIDFVTNSQLINGRSPSLKATNIIEIFTASDLPSPVSGLITLPSGRYIFNANFSFSSDSLFVDSGNFVTIESADARNDSIIYTGEGTFLTVDVDAVGAEMVNVNVSCTGTNAMALDVNGGVFNLRIGQIVMSGTNSSLGVLSGVGVVLIKNFNLLGFTNGLVFQEHQGLLIDQVLMQSNGLGSGAFFSFDEDPLLFGFFTTLVALPSASESVFFIDPIVDAAINIFNTFNLGAGSFFKGGTTGLISKFVDVSTSVTADTVSNSGGNALFTSFGHGLNVGETVVHTTHDESSYNGSFGVTSITSNTYLAGITFVAADTGLFATTTAQVNDVAHGLSNGTSVSIFNTVNFGGGYEIFNNQTDSFEITLGKAFPGSETIGNWDTGSLDEMSPFVTALHNGVQKDSRSVAFGFMNGNTDATTITDGVYDTLVVTGFSSNGSTSGWILVDSISAAFKYIGITPISQKIEVSISAEKGGSPASYRFIQSVNGNIQTFDSEISYYAPLQITTANVSTTLRTRVDVLPDDIINFLGAGVSTTDAITITDFLIDFE